MLLKYSQAQKRMKSTGTGKPQRATGMMKMTSGLVNVVPRIHRKVLKAASKRPNSHRSLTVSKREERTPVDPCDNSNDSGLGFDHHLEYQTTPQASLRFSEKEWWNYSAKAAPKHRMSCITSVFRPPVDAAVHLTCWPEESPEVKRRRLEIKLESDDANDNFSFPETVTSSRTSLCVPVSRPARGKISPTTSGFNLPPAPLTLSSQLSSTSRNGRIYLQILCQPEQQHRARYQTEGSRGAVKDRTGNGFPVVKLVGYDQPASLQVFIGTDQGRVVPHMFYQACRVSGKNSTPCAEKKVDGTIVIEVDVEPSKDMVVTCDCVGILKERNVDVEHRFPEEGSGRSKKKSTRCRMVFRTSVTHPDGSVETLQVTSQPIVCTQPPGVPEICKKSLTSCAVTGGQELFILGKNFLKDTRVIFQEGEGGATSWKQSVQPDKEFLQQSHLVCTVPAYQRTDITEAIAVRLSVESSGKSSEPHTFLYTPVTTGPAVSPSDKSNSTALTTDGNLYTSGTTGTSNTSSVGLGTFMSESSISVSSAQPLLLNTDTGPAFIPSEPNTGQEEKVHPVMLWPAPLSTIEKPIDIASQMMPPPPLLPISMRRPSLQMIVPEISQEELKKEMPDNSEVSQSFVPLPSLSVENFLSNLDAVNNFPKEQLKTQIIPDVPQLIDQTVVKNVYEEPVSNIMNSVPTLAPTVLMRSSPPLDFSTSAANISQESLSMISNKTVSDTPVSTPLQVRTMDLQHSSLISQEQKARLDALVSSALVAPTSATDRLDAFVNSAADSHMSPVSSPTILSPDPSRISPIQVITVPETTHMSPIQTMTVTESSHLNSIQPMTVSETSRISPIQAMTVSEISHLSPIQNLAEVTESSHMNTIQTLTVSDPNITIIHQDTRPLSQMLQDNPIQSQPSTQALTESSLCSLLSSTQSMSNMVTMDHLSSQPMNLTQSGLSIGNPSQYDEKFSTQKVATEMSTNQNLELKESNQFLMSIPTNQNMERKESNFLMPTQESVIVSTMKADAAVPPPPQGKKCEEGMPLPHELTNMSEHDLLSYINTSYFDKV